MLEWTAPLSGKEPPLTSSELRYLRRPSSYSHQKAFEELGYVPQVDLDAGIARVREWLIETGRFTPDRK
jgi:nucleoside-diphosphate-sugar epimerase